MLECPPWGRGTIRWNCSANLTLVYGSEWETNEEGADEEGVDEDEDDEVLIEVGPLLLLLLLLKHFQGLHVPVFPHLLHSNNL